MRFLNDLLHRFRLNMLIRNLVFSYTVYPFRLRSISGKQAVKWSVRKLLITTRNSTFGIRVQLLNFPISQRSQSHYHAFITTGTSAEEECGIFRCPNVVGELVQAVRGETSNLDYCCRTPSNPFYCCDWKDKTVNMVGIDPNA